MHDKYAALESDKICYPSAIKSPLPQQDRYHKVFLSFFCIIFPLHARMWRRTMKISSWKARGEKMIKFQQFQAKPQRWEEKEWYNHKSLVGVWVERIPGSLIEYLLQSWQMFYGRVQVLQNVWRGLLMEAYIWMINGW